MSARDYQIPDKEEAWKDPPQMRQIAIRQRRQFRFTRRWFMQRNCATFSTFLPPKFDGSQPIKLLQIGVFEGMDLVWQLQNTASHPDRHVVAIDPWLATKTIDAHSMEAVCTRAMFNLTSFKNVHLIRNFSQQVLGKAHFRRRNRLLPKNKFDLVVIDGDHSSLPVLTDAMLSLPLLKPGGWMIFDDVRNDINKPRDHVIHGLRVFLEVAGDRIKPAWSHRYCECFEKL